jgi:hypothetical protein
MRRASAFASLATCAILLVSDGPARSADDPSTLDVHFKLTDLDYKPIPGQTVRLVFGSEPGRQPPTGGYSFVTDVNGDARFGAMVTIDKRLRKIPTNFVDSLFSHPKLTDHLTVAAELDYMTYRWLYAVDMFRFPEGGDVMLDGFTVFTRDAQGRFTRKAVQTDGGWRMADLGGLILTTPGHEPWNFALEPGSDPAHWTLQLAFKRYPAPVRR